MNATVTPNYRCPHAKLYEITKHKALNSMLDALIISNLINTVYPQQELTKSGSRYHIRVS